MKKYLLIAILLLIIATLFYNYNNLLEEFKGVINNVVFNGYITAEGAGVESMNFVASVLSYNHLQIYANGINYPFFTINHPPFYYWLASKLFSVYGVNFISGRVITLISSLFLYLILFLCVKKLTKSLILGLIAIFFALHTSWIFKIIFYPDMFAVMLSFFSIYFFLLYDKNNNNYSYIYLSAILSVLSIYSKHCFYSAFITIVVYLSIFAKDWKALVRYMCIFLFLSITVFLAINYKTKNAFYNNIISLQLLIRNTWSWNIVLVKKILISYLSTPWVKPVLVLSSVGLVIESWRTIIKKDNNRGIIFCIYLLVSLYYPLNALGYDGPDYYLMEFHYINCILASLSIFNVIEYAFFCIRKTKLPNTIILNKELLYSLLIIFLLCIPPDAKIDGLFSNHPTIHKHKKEYIEFLNKLSSQGLVLTDGLANHDFVLNNSIEPKYLTNFWVMKAWEWAGKSFISNNSELLNDIRSQKYCAFLTVGNTPNNVQEVIETYYDYTEKLSGIQVFYPKKAGHKFYSDADFRDNNICLYMPKDNEIRIIVLLEEDSIPELAAIKKQKFSFSVIEINNLKINKFKKDERRYFQGYFCDNNTNPGDIIYKITAKSGIQKLNISFDPRLRNDINYKNYFTIATSYNGRDYKEVWEKRSNGNRAWDPYEPCKILDLDFTKSVKKTVYIKFEMKGGQLHSFPPDLPLEFKLVLGDIKKNVNIERRNYNGQIRSGKPTGFGYSPQS